MIRYSTFNILSLLSIGCWAIFQFWFGPLSLRLKFDGDPISGLWNISLIIFWGLLPLEVVFISSNIHFWFGPLNLSFKFEEDPISSYFTSNILRSFSIRGCLHFVKQYSILVWSPLFESKIWGRSDHWLLRYSTLNMVFFHWRSSSFQAIFNFCLVP